jgi:branched-chain amino acid transport system permease protein
MDFLNTLVQGILLGGVYTLFAIGLSLMFGVMRLVNIAHGDLAVLAGFAAIVMINDSGFHPLLAVLVAFPVAFLIGYLLQKEIFNRVLGEDLLPPMIVTFGLSIVIQNSLLETFSANSQKVSVGPIETASFKVTDTFNVGIFPLLVFVIAIATIVCLQLLFYKTKLGREFRATSDDPQAANLMGIDTSRVFAIATGVAVAVIGVAGILMAIRSTIDPFAGPVRLLFAFEAVIIGGLGSIWGTLAGGILLGLSQAVGGSISPQLQILAGHVTFLIILLVRPRGLFPKVQH